jgi:hypothetical protein
MSSEWKTLSACNAERSLAKLRSSHLAVRFVKMNGNSLGTAARNGPRSNAWPMSNTTALKTKRRNFSASGPNRNSPSASARGGIRAIAISHPHFYSSMVEWSERFDAQIFLHAADREWVMRESSRIQFWEGTTQPLWDSLSLINCGGHFDGGTVLHWPAGANGKGALVTGDIIQVVQDRRCVSFMRSYPNLIPLGAAAIHHILEMIEPFSFDQIYGAWWEANVLSDAKAAVAQSAQRYLRAIAP